MIADQTWRLLAEELLNAPTVERNGRRFASIPGDVILFTQTPLVSLRRTAWKNALREFEWLCYGNGCVGNLHPAVRHWWARWADHYSCVDGVGLKPGDAGRFSRGVAENPESRRNVLATWSLPSGTAPRNDFVAVATADGGALDLFVFQRTCDLTRGAPHNWVQYWALLLWTANGAGLRPRALRWVTGDVHLYEQHRDLVTRAAVGVVGPVPQLIYTPTGPDFRASDFTLDGPYAPVVRENAEYV